jgi:DNA-binding CsgD family transcriptional regulator
MQTDDASLLDLHPDERRVLQLMASGATLREAAVSLHVSRRTCARRLAAAKAKLGAQTTAEAVLRVARQRACGVVVAMLVLLHAGADGFDLVNGPLGLVC